MTDRRFDSLLEVLPGVSRETFQQLRTFESELLRWNKRINLIGETTEDEFWVRHVLDSAQLAPMVPNACKWLDLGSGGGMPGIILAIVLAVRPNAHVDLIESNRKKAGFLQAMIGHLGLAARVHAARIEAVTVDKVEVVTARALARLPALLGLSEQWLSNGAVGLFQKGRDYRQELSESAQLWSFDLLEHPSAVVSDSMILEMSNLMRIRGKR